MKNSPILFALFGYDEFSKRIQEKINCEIGSLILHSFPDEESMVTVNTDVTGREVILVTSLDRPNSKIIPLIFTAETLKKLGATKVTLVAPYLAYMRQDKAFHRGEGVSAKYFARLLSNYFDKLITLDPHLHRITSLNEIYSIPTHVLHATKNIADWIYKNIENPILIGPDIESTQWVEEVAKYSKAPYLILRKERKDDHTVSISIPELDKYPHATPILIDDIISTAMTMIEAIKHLNSCKTLPPICIGVHAVFADDAYQRLLNAGIAKVITCNSIQHASNGIDVSGEIAKALI